MASVLSLAPAVATTSVPTFDMPNFDVGGWLVARVAGDLVNNAWMGFCQSLWAAALWTVQFVFKLVDAFTTPDLSAGGPMASIYPATFAIGGALALVLAFVQVGFAAWQRNGQGLARIAVGVGQFGLVWAGMVSIAAMLVVATSGLTRGLLQLGLGQPSFGNLNIVKPITVRDGFDATVASLLGFCGLLLILASIGYLAIMLVRAGALVLITVTSPISAAGLVAEGTRTWFWKALRWFLAALMMAPLSALIFTIGIKVTEGVVAGG